MFELKLNLMDQVWEKAHLVPGLDPKLFRRDEQGTVIRKGDFNDESSIYGWCFHHLTPIWEGGVEEAGNLQPLNCTNRMFSLAGTILPWREDSELWD
jgi:hypothetical protein